MMAFCHLPTATDWCTGTTLEQTTHLQSYVEQLGIARAEYESEMDMLKEIFTNCPDWQRIKREAETTFWTDATVGAKSFRK
jgi:flagellar biosynthesis chaperone FliJ